MRCSPWIHLRTFIVPILSKLFTSRFKDTKSNHVCVQHEPILLTVALMSCLKKMNKELTNVSDWFNANKLSLNVKKTNYSFSTNHQKR